MRLVRIGVVLGLLVAASACGGDDDAATTTVEPSVTATAPTTDSTTPATTTIEPVPTTTGPAPTTTESVPTTTEPTMLDVRVYLLRGERLAIEHRDVAGPAVLRGALTELLLGPSADEANDGVSTTIPAGTSLRSVNLDDRIATVDLSGEFATGGGSMSMLARVAQVVFTATQFDNVDAVRFWLDGAPIDYLGGEGIVLDEPQTRSDVPRELTGGILFDLPEPGSTVTNPFTVTGEGDVFEGDFPLWIRRDGVQLGDILIVRAGAWGEWADFTATVTVDADPGPIEIVAVDQSGCGPPDCPPPTDIVVPVVLAR